MIIVIANQEKDRETGRIKMIVSHGVDEETGQVITLPQVEPHLIGSFFNLEIGEYTL